MKQFKVGDVVLYTPSYGKPITAVVIDCNGYYYYLDKFGYIMDFHADELELIK